MPTRVRRRKSRTGTKTGSNGNDSAPPEREPGRAVSFLKRAGIDTWPKKVAAAVLGALLASGLSYFIGADFWKNVEKKTGLAGAPVQVTTLTDIDTFDTDVIHVPEFVVERPIGEVPRPPSGNSFDGRWAWAKKMDGVDGLMSLIRVTVAGKESSPVVLQGLDVRVAGRRPPMKGTLLSYSGLGAPQSVRYIEVDLAKQPPEWTYRGAEGKPEEHFPLRVSASDSEVFDVHAVSLRDDVSWSLEFHYTADGEPGSFRVDDDGKPFRTTATDNADGHWWVNGRWTPLPQ